MDVLKKGLDGIERVVKKYDLSNCPTSAHQTDTMTKAHQEVDSTNYSVDKQEEREISKEK
jgi:hypothetical protein